MRHPPATDHTSRPTRRALLQARPATVAGWPTWTSWLFLADGYQPPAGASAFAWLANVTMLQAFAGQPNVIGLYWSLAWEVAFYVGMSILFVLSLSRRSVLLAFTCNGALVAGALALVVAAMHGAGASGPTTSTASRPAPHSHEAARRHLGTLPLVTGNGDERRRRDAPAPDGLVVVDKPAGWTSHDVVARVRRLAGTRRVGHAGTLDPMATGVLVVGVERATRLLTFLVGADKEYTATVRLGVTTTTDDAEGQVLVRADASGTTPVAIGAGVATLTGSIEQVPSAVSAIKVDGRRAYARVRAGEQVVLAARPVTIRAFDVLGVRPVAATTGDELPAVDVDVRVVCSSGTYVRALARDLGAALGVGGHLTALRRTRVGGYGLDVARTLAELEADFTALPLAAAARAVFPVRELSESEVRELSHGRPIAVAAIAGSGAAPVAAFAPDGTLVALLADDGARSRPVVVLAPA